MQSSTINNEHSHQTADMALSGQHSTTPIQADIAATAIDSSLKPPLRKAEPDDELRGLIINLVKDIKECEVASLSSRIRIGLHLHHFRAGTELDDWSVTLASDLLPFKPRVVQDMARIGSNPALTNPGNAHGLPEAMRTLYHLAAVPPVVLNGMIARGEITKRTTRDFALSLARQYAKAKVVPPPVNCPPAQA